MVTVTVLVVLAVGLGVSIDVAIDITFADNFQLYRFWSASLHHSGVSDIQFFRLLSYSN